MFDQYTLYLGWYTIPTLLRINYTANIPTYTYRTVQQGWERKKEEGL